MNNSICNVIHLFREKYQGLLTYYVPQTNEVKWSSMFDLMETAKRELGIEDYSLSQTTLEQVFLSFSKSLQSSTVQYQCRV